MGRNAWTAALAAALAVAGSAARVGAAAPRRATTAAGIVVGRADAPHRLLLVTAFSCPYCRALDQEGMPEIAARWTRSGVALEYLPTILSPPDAVSNVALQCGPPDGLPRRAAMLFRAQSQMQTAWRAAGAPTPTPGAAMTPREAAALAAASGLPALAPQIGVAPAALARCLTDRGMLAKVAAWDARARRDLHIEGTPTAFLDGARIGSTWPEIRRALAAAR